MIHSRARTCCHGYGGEMDGRSGSVRTSWGWRT
jgi:hypothetical protein